MIAAAGVGGQPQQQQQQQQQQQFQQHQAPVPGSLAQVQTATMAGQQQQHRYQQGLPPQSQQQPQHQSQQTTVQQRHNMLIDPPEVIAQQQRLLTEATRKVQEHVYYMKQSMERNDLPGVLDRASQMVSELGEHAHSHQHHHFHPPAPGATGTTTALNPKNYYELHLRTLEELPALEEYLLGIASSSKQQQQQQQQLQNQQQQQIQQQNQHQYHQHQQCNEPSRNESRAIRGNCKRFGYRERNEPHDDTSWTAIPTAAISTGSTTQH